MVQQEEVITISVPLLEKYVTVIRLSASGIAVQMGFTYEVIQNIMSAISEVMDKGMNLFQEGDCDFTTNFRIKEENKLVIELTFVPVNKENNVERNAPNDFSLPLTRALMDSVSIKPQTNCFNVVIEKELNNLKVNPCGKNNTA
jgi:hypothetical protein